MALNPFQNWIMKQAVKMHVKSATFSELIHPQRTKEPIWTDWSGEEAVRSGYKSSVYVYACIDRIAKAASSVPWKVFKEVRPGEWEEVPGHPMAQLIQKPNPYMARKDFIEIMTAHLYLTGNSVNTKVRGVGGVVGELWPLMPDHIKPIADQKNYIRAYRYDYDNVKRDFKPEEILHAMFIDPSNFLWGLAPLQVAAKTVDTDVEAVNWNKVALQNRAVTDGAFITDQPLTGEQFDEVREQIREQHQGSANARAPWVLGAGARWEQMSLNPVEMDFINSRRFTREEICAIFHVPPPLVGILDKANYSNTKEFRRIFWLDTVIPFLDEIKSALNLSLLPDFQAGNEVLELRYDLQNVEALQENFSDKLNNAKNIWSMGVPFNMINQKLELGFDDIEGGDVGYLPTSIIPANMLMVAPPEEEPEPPPEDDPEPPVPPVEPEDEEEYPSGENNGEKAANIKGFSMAAKGINIDTEEKAVIYWKSVERQRTPFYMRMSAEVSRMFGKQATEAAKAYKKGGLKAFNSAIDKSKGDWEKLFAKNYLDVIAHFGKETDETLKSFGPSYVKEDEEIPPPPPPPELPIVMVFDPYNEEIAKYIQTVTAYKVTNVLEFTKSHIASIILAMRNDNETTDAIARRIRDEIGLFSTHRAFRIARTEVASAANYGSLTAAKQTGIVQKKKWVSSRDDRVRELHTHKGVDGEEVGLDEKFSNGLMHPGDFGGAAKEVIHCRCALSYTVRTRALSR